MSVPKPTEQTITSILKELLKNKVKTAPEVSIETPVGRRLQPDLFIQNGGNYVVQAKLGDEAKTIDAMGQVYDCIRYLGVIGGFAVIYPEELRKPMPTVALEKLALETKHKVIGVFSDHRPGVLSFTGSLPEIASWIAQHVLKPPEYIEPDVDFSIRALRNVAQYITTYLQYLKEADLKDIFGGKTVFENILQYEEGKYPLDEMRQATAYLLINQLLFYNVLSSIDPIKYPKIDEDKLGAPKDLLQYFNRVLAVDYSATFGFDVASRIPDKAINEVREVTKVIKALAPERIRHDVLGQLFHKVIPFDTRKAVAAFYTNVNVAEMLARLVVEKPDDKAIDLAVGSGGLIAAVYRAKRDLLEKYGKKFELEDHRRFVEEDLTGIDIMPFAAHVAAINLSLQAPPYETEKVRIAVWDSTELEPGRVIPAVSKELARAYRQPTLEMFAEGPPRLKEEAYVKKGVVTFEGIGGEDISLEHVDVVIMNPPFTRQERLPQTYKRHLDESFSEYQQYFHGQLGLHGFFIFLSDRFLQPGGRIALVLPATVLRVRSMEKVRRFLSRHYEIKYIITAWKKLAFSESAWVREILLIARKLGDGKKAVGCCNIVTLRRMPANLEEAQKFSQEIRENRLADVTEVYESNNLYMMAVSQRELSQEKKDWFSYIAVYNPDIRNSWKSIITAGEDKLISFRKYSEKKHLRINRGVETRSKNDVPVQSMMIGFSEDRLPRTAYAWVLEKVGRRSITARNRFTGNTVTIPSSAYAPCLVTYSAIPTINLTEKTDFIVVSRFRGIEKFLQPELRNRVLRLLLQWRKYVNGRLGNLLVCRRYVPTAPGFHHTCFYTETPIAPPGMMWSIRGGSSEDSKIIALWMNSTLHLCQILLHKIQDIWIDIHEYALNSLLILDPEVISRKERKYLLSTFNTVGGNVFPSLKQQIETSFEGREKIDLALLRCLGLNENEARKFLAELYDAVTQEFRMVKELEVKTS